MSILYIDVLVYLSFINDGWKYWSWDNIQSAKLQSVGHDARHFEPAVSSSPRIHSISLTRASDCPRRQSSRSRPIYEAGRCLEHGTVV